MTGNKFLAAVLANMVAALILAGGGWLYWQLRRERAS